MTTKIPAELISTATPLGRRNILINGDFGIYQRAQQVTGIGASSEYFTADRWHIDTGNSAGRLIMTAGTADAPAESNVTTSMKLDCTTADTSIAAGEYLTLNQKIEGQNIQHIKKGTSGAKQLTASFWVQGNASATYVVELYDNDNGRQISKTFAVTSSWSKVELTFPADTTGAFDNDANSSLTMNIWIHAGSNYTGGTLNSSAWAAQTAANRAAGIDSFYSSTSNELYITAVQLEVGDVATEFEILSYPERLALCQRYYQKYGPYGTNTFPLGPVGYCYAGTAHAVGHNITTPLRAAPDIEATGTLQMRGAQNDGGNDARDVTAITSHQLGNNSISWNVTAQTGATIGTTPIVGGGSNTTFVAYDSEL